MLAPEFQCSKLSSPRSKPMCSSAVAGAGSVVEGNRGRSKRSGLCLIWAHSGRSRLAFHLLRAGNSSGRAATFSFDLLQTLLSQLTLPNETRGIRLQDEIACKATPRRTRTKRLKGQRTKPLFELLSIGCLTCVMVMLQLVRRPVLP